MSPDESVESKWEIEELAAVVHEWRRQEFVLAEAQVGTITL